MNRREEAITKVVVDCLDFQVRFIIVSDCCSVLILIKNNLKTFTTLFHNISKTNQSIYTLSLFISETRPLKSGPGHQRECTTFLRPFLTHSDYISIYFGHSNIVFGKCLGVCFILFSIVFKLQFVWLPNIFLNFHIFNTVVAS